MIRRMMLCALALIFLAASAAAEMEAQLLRRAAVVTREGEETAPLYALPDTDSAVLMEYYGGAPAEVIRPVGSGFYLTQIGEQGASLMGYMRAEQLAIGEAECRKIPPRFMKLKFNEAASVYDYCDTGARVIGSCEPGKTYYAMSKNDGKWVQLFLPPVTHIWQEEERMTCGFVQLKTGLARGYWQAPREWAAESLPGGVTQEQAIDIAIEYLDGSGAGGLPEVYTSRTELEKMDHRACAQVWGENAEKERWCIFFWQSVQSDAAYVLLTPEKDGTLHMVQSYVPQGAWDGYSFTPVL